MNKALIIAAISAVSHNSFLNSIPNVICLSLQLTLQDLTLRNGLPKPKTISKRLTEKVSSDFLTKKAKLPIKLLDKLVNAHHLITHCLFSVSVQLTLNQHQLGSMV